MLSIGVTRFYGGGIPICPRADPHDGELDVTLVHDVGRMGILPFDRRIRAGRHEGHADVTMLRSASIELVASPDIVAYADGERIGAAPLRVEAARGALTLCVPPGAVRR